MKTGIIYTCCAILLLAAGCSKDTTTLVEGATLKISPENDLVFTPVGGEDFITVETNQGKNWDATSDAEWVAIDMADNGFSVIVSANNSAVSRSATITVTAGTAPNIDSETIEVDQYGLDEAYLILRPSTDVRFPYGGGERTVVVETNQGSWSVASDQTWLTINEAADRFTIAAGENTSSDARPEAVVTVSAGPDYNAASGSFTVNQEGKPAISGVNLSAGGSANSYVVPGPGTYFFDAKLMGNNAVTGDISPSPLNPASVEMLWQDYYASGQGLIKSISLKENGYVEFQTADTFHEGNAIVAVRDSSGKIIWSWHLWFVSDLADKEIADATANNALLCVMQDRNLGAVSATPGDNRALGLIYQWGRKDPFIGAAGKGYSEMTRESTYFLGTNVTTTTGTAFTYDFDGTVNNSASRMIWQIEVGAPDVETAVANPTTYYTYSPDVDPITYDWLLTSDNSLWGNPWEGRAIYPAYSDRYVNSGAGSKSIYDPCPVGYRVAPMDTWVRSGVVAGNQRTEFDTANYGYKFKIVRGAPSEAIWYPLAGYRSHSGGQLFSAGSAGFVWMSSPGDPENITYHKLASCVSSSIVVLTTAASTDRARGYPVRCVKE